MTEALASQLRQDDPDRHAMALLAPPKARARLVTLYALNLELARTPLAARDPMIAEIRVQWWIDRLSALADAPPPPHEMLTPLHDAWGADAARLSALAEGRLRDAEHRPFEDAAELRSYIDATAGTLMAAAARAVGMPEPAGPVIAAQARGAGLAAWLGAEPTLSAMNLGLRDPGSARALAVEGIEALATARQGRHLVPRYGAAALYPGTGAEARLRALAAGEALPPPPSDFARRAALMRLALTGRWWGRR
ncbi:squalene/phytoene synthase family protein [Paracoccus sp. Z118]|uniref:squalene/phytoene synthase family protein n=1 Tax=Paracoccus sp. Z118 TaxID=2851017 RepID=UPI001C2BDC82|nr:squalene/phytoene synthase family protein [Paracoccus sp. Z118]MBV0890365.1 squalene/phytoene synthase family protein [Paracoccus sp. Z118]